MSPKIKKSILLFSIAVLAVLSLVVMGLAVVKGVDSGSIPYFGAPHFAIAISMLILSVCCFLYWMHYKWIIIFLAIFVCIIVIFNIFAEVFPHFFELSNTTLFAYLLAPIPMQISTAIIAGSLCILILASNREMLTTFFACILCCFVIGLAFFVLVSCLFGENQFSSYNGFVMLLLLGSVLYMFIRDDAYLVRKSDFLSIFLPISFVAVCTYTIWKAYRTNEESEYIQIVEHQAEYLEKMINKTLAQYVDALAHLSQNSVYYGQFIPQLWRADSSYYLKNYSAISFMQLYNENFELLENAPKRMGSFFESAGLFSQLQPDLMDGKNVFLSRDPQETLLCIYPVIVNGVFSGVLLGSINLHELFENIYFLFDDQHYNFQFIVLKQRQVLYSSPRPTMAFSENPITKKVGGEYIDLKLQMYFGKKDFSHSFLYVSILITCTGIVIAALVGFLSYFFQSIRKKNALLELANRDLQFARANAESAARAKGAFLANMSHEIRTPLNAIVGTLQLLGNFQGDEKQKKYINRIKVSSDALLNLMNDILDYSKIESGNFKLMFEPADVVQTVVEAAEMFSTRAAEKNILLLLDLPTQPLPKCVIDQHRVKQVLVNFISNALKFTEKGSITVRLQYKQSGEKQSSIRLEVEDTGIGISKENCRKLFKRFSQIEMGISRKFGGVGLGLSISKNLVTMMKGKIDVESEEGKGSIFSFEIAAAVDIQSQVESLALEPIKVFVSLSQQKEEEIVKRYLTDLGAKILPFESEETPEVAILTDDRSEKVLKWPERSVRVIWVRNEMINEETLLRPITPQRLFHHILSKGDTDG